MRVCVFPFMIFYVCKVFFLLSFIFFFVCVCVFCCTEMLRKTREKLTSDPRGSMQIVENR